MFGTSPLLGPDTDIEIATGKYMQGAWVAFAKDPVNGLSDYGWPTYMADEDGLVELALEGQVEAAFVRGDTYDETCSG